MFTQLPAVRISLAELIERFRARGYDFEKAMLAADAVSRAARLERVARDLLDEERKLQASDGATRLSEGEVRDRVSHKLSGRERVPFDQARAAVERLCTAPVLPTIDLHALVHSYLGAGHPLEIAQQLADAEVRGFKRALGMGR